MSEHLIIAMKRNTARPKIKVVSTTISLSPLVQTMINCENTKIRLKKRYSARFN